MNTYSKIIINLLLSILCFVIATYFTVLATHGGIELSIFIIGGVIAGFIYLIIALIQFYK